MKFKYVLKKIENKRHAPSLFNSIAGSKLKRGNDDTAEAATAAGSASDETETRSTGRICFSDLQLSTLDTVFVSSKGSPDQSVLQRTAKALKLDGKQVECFIHISYSYFGELL